MGETSMTLVLSLLVFNSFEGNPSGLPKFVFISSLLFSLSGLSFSCLFADAICTLCIDEYLSMSLCLTETADNV